MRHASCEGDYEKHSFDRNDLVRKLRQLAEYAKQVVESDGDPSLWRLTRHDKMLHAESRVARLLSLLLFAATR